MSPDLPIAADPTYRGPGSPILSARHAAAEATAAAALALIQHNATWEGLHAAAMAAEESTAAAALDALAQLVDNPGRAAHAVALLESVDHQARLWGNLAHPGSGARRSGPATIASFTPAPIGAPVGCLRTPGRP